MGESREEMLARMERMRQKRREKMTMSRTDSTEPAYKVPMLMQGDLETLAQEALRPGVITWMKDDSPLLDRLHALMMAVRKRTVIGWMSDRCLGCDRPHPPHRPCPNACPCHEIKELLAQAGREVTYR